MEEIKESRTNHAILAKLTLNQQETSQEQGLEQPKNFGQHRDLGFSNSKCQNQSDSWKETKGY